MKKLSFLIATVWVFLLLSFSTGHSQCPVTNNLYGQGTAPTQAGVQVSISDGSWIGGNICSWTGEDSQILSVTGGTTYQITSDPDPVYPTHVSYISVYDASGVLVEHGLVDCETIPLVFTATISGTYTVVISVSDADCTTVEEECRNLEIECLSCGTSSLTINCPGDHVLPACSDQSTIDFSFSEWLGGFNVIDPGCGIISETDLTTFGPPDPCGGTTLVDYVVGDDCGDTAVCSALFTVEQPAPIGLFCPPSLTFSSCDFEDQAALDQAYFDWLNGIGFTGGCGTEVFTETTGSLPGRCTGGEVFIIFNAFDGCGQFDSCSSGFTVTGDTGCPGCEPPSVTIAEGPQVSSTSCCCEEGTGTGVQEGGYGQ